MDSACDRCAKSMKDGDLQITCMGFCSQVVHAKCANLNSAFVKVLNERSNLFWMCDECVKLMKLARFKNTVSSMGNVISAINEHQEAVFAELKQEIANHGQQIAQLTKKVTIASPAPVFSFRSLDNATPNRPSIKRRREDGFETAKPLKGGTRSGDDALVATVPLPDELFWLYLSRIHPSVKSEAVEKLAKNGLGCDTPMKVIPLIKKGTDINTLNFISYKIGIPPNLRESALNPDTWPKGIMFREFEDSRAKNAWIPPLVQPPITVTPIPALEVSAPPVPPVADPTVPMPA